MSVLPKILHVEDDADIREIARLALETLGGLTVEQCASGAEALTRAPDVSPDLFLLDMSMPDMNGVETLTALRALDGFAETPAIFMTARAQDSEHQDLLDQGGNAVIVKPFDATALAAQVLQIWDDLRPR